MNVDNKERRLLVGITGASGSIYAERLIKIALDHFDRIYVIATDAGKSVAQHELVKRVDDFSLLRILDRNLLEVEKRVVRIFDNSDLFAPVASGTACATDMVVVPCSMGTLARIAGGMSSNLIERSSDVMLKERRRLVIVPRETPLNRIHLRNMLSLDEMGARIVPPTPAFYQKPQTLDDQINFVVGKILESLDVVHNLYKPWNSRMI